MKKPIIILALFGALGTCAFIAWRVSLLSVSVPTDGPVVPYYPEIAEGIGRVVQHGDVIFRGRDNSWGELGARLSDKDRRFGHVGVVSLHDNQWYVIDAGGHPFDKEATVARQPLAHFLYASERSALYRPRLTRQQFKTYQLYIDWHLEHATPFDRDFSLTTPQTVYCTELIWRAMTTAINQDPVDEMTQWNGARVIAIDDLQASPFLDEVISVDIKYPQSLP